MDKYFSVQFSLNDKGPSYIFKLRDIFLNRLCILVKNDSAVLKHLMVGDILDMEYIPRKSPGSADSLKTLIKNISKNPQDLFTEHSLIELSIFEQQGDII